MQGKVEGKRRRRAKEDEVVGGHHRLDGHEFEQALGVGDSRSGTRKIHHDEGVS